MTFTGVPAPQPEGLSLKARLCWSYFFDNGWAVVRTNTGVYIITDEACELERSEIFPDEESLISWLESVADEHLEDDPKNFLSCFVSIPDLLSPAVIDEMKKLV